MRFSANISTLFTEVEFLDRFEAAALANFAAIECQYPYAHDPNTIVERMHRHGQSMVLHNLPPGDDDVGRFGLACHAHKRAEFRESVELAIRYAKILNCPRLHCLAGCVDDKTYGTNAHTTYVDNLKYAADELGKHGLQLLIEPINDRDVPGYVLTTIEQAVEILELLQRDNVKLQCDLYHLAMMKTPLVPALEKYIHLCGHMQFADFPNRNEPGTGQLDFDGLFERIRQLGYTGYLGAEYNPSKPTHETLDWFRRYSS